MVQDGTIVTIGH